MRNALIVFGISAFVGACATTPTLQAFGGSRADGVVRLGFTYGAFENPRPDMVAAQETARQRCAVWGYQNAEPFGGATQQCLQTNQYGCVQTQVTVEYQCTGGAGAGATTTTQPPK